MPTENAAPPGHSLLYWLGLACERVRKEGRVKMHEIVGLAKLDATNLYRFESGKSWPEHIERVVAAYAQAAGLDARLVWLDAVERWLREGSRPTVSQAGTLTEDDDGAVSPRLLKDLERLAATAARDFERSLASSVSASSDSRTRAASAPRARP